MARYVTAGGGSGGGSVAAPTGDWAEDANVDDALAVRTMLAEDANVDDVIAYLLATNPENAAVDDQFSFPALNGAWAEDGQANDLAKLTISSVIVGRSGTPDSDPMGDAWTDQASTGTNHGNGSLTVKGKSTLANDEQRGFLLVDLTNYTNCTPVNGLAGGTNAFNIQFKASNAGLLLAETVTGTFGAGATRPFTESTLNWSNQPTPSGLSTGTFSVPAGGAVTQVGLGISASALSSIFAAGGWLLLGLTCASTAIPNVITVLSRDDATASNRPTWSMTVQRGT